MRRLFALGATAALVLTLAACGDDKDRTVVVNPQPAPSSTVVNPPPANNTVVVPQSGTTRTCPAGTVC